MSKLLLENCTLLDPYGTLGFVENGFVLIEDDTIVNAGSQVPEVEEAEHVDLNSAIVLPGLVNAHTHLYSALALGLPPPRQAPESFLQILERVWWRLDKALDEESTRASFEAGLLACLRAGTTTVIDHHSSPNFVSGSLDLLAELAEKFGITISVCFEGSERNGLDIFDKALDENVSMLWKWAENPYVHALLGLHASFTIGDDSMLKVREAMDENPGTGVHIHVDEGPEDCALARKIGYRSTVDRLDQFGLLTEDSLIVHGVHCDDMDRELLCKRGVMLVHNPTSNANNRVGLPARELLHECEACLGTDGMQANMLAEAKEGTLIWNRSLHTGDTAPDLLKMLLDTNPKTASRLFNRSIGHIAEGYSADLVVYPYESRTPLKAENGAGHLLFGLDRPPIHVITRGEFRIRDGELVGLDEQGILSNARTQAARLWSAMKPS